MNLEQLFDAYATELSEIYEEYEVNEKAIQKIEEAVKEKLENRVQIDPVDFLSIISSVASSTYATNKRGIDVNLTYKNILKRVNHAVGLYIDADAELTKEDDYSDGNHI